MTVKNLINKTMNKTIIFSIFGIYHILYGFFTTGAIFFAHVYLNSAFIPKSFRWENGRLKDDLRLFKYSMIILDLIEIGLLIFILYYINMWFLTKTNYLKNKFKLSLVTAIITILVAPIIYFLILQLTL